MDLSSLTLPNLSQLGQKNTIKKKLERPDVKNVLMKVHDVYQRAGLVLPTTCELYPSVDVVDAIANSDNDNARLALPQTIIDIETALFQGYAVVLTIELYGKPPKEDSVLEVPNTDKTIVDIVQIVLVGYDRNNRLFLALTEDNVSFTIAYNYVADELVAFDLWAVVR